MNIIVRSYLINWGPVFVWAFFIYYLSGIPHLSSNLEYDFILRKCAHVLEFLILSVLTGRAMLSKKNLKVQISLVAAFIFSVFYAFLDEWHQSKVIGRHGCLEDVFIDCIGIGIGIIGMIVLLRLKGD